jgi:hypothetical protein
MADMRKVAEMSVESYDLAIANEMTNFRQAQLNSDESEMVASANRIAALRSAKREIPMMYSEATSPRQAAPQVNQNGLTEVEAEVARNSFGPVKDARGNMVDMTIDQKEKLYRYNRDKYQYMRQSGQYRDDQGRR